MIIIMIALMMNWFGAFGAFGAFAAFGSFGGDFSRVSVLWCRCPSCIVLEEWAFFADRDSLFTYRSRDGHGDAPPDPHDDRH